MNDTRSGLIAEPLEFRDTQPWSSFFVKTYDLSGNKLNEKSLFTSGMLRTGDWTFDLTTGQLYEGLPPPPTPSVPEEHGMGLISPTEKSGQIWTAPTPIVKQAGFLWVIAILLILGLLAGDKGSISNK